MIGKTGRITGPEFSKNGVLVVILWLIFYVCAIYIDEAIFEGEHYFFGSLGMIMMFIPGVILLFLVVKRLRDCDLPSLTALPVAVLAGASLFSAQNGLWGIAVPGSVVCLGFLFVLSVIPSTGDNAYGPCPVERRSVMRPRHSTHAALSLKAKRLRGMLVELHETTGFRLRSFQRSRVGGRASDRRTSYK